MPREFIPSVDVSVHPPEVWVCWGPDTHVQVATTPGSGISAWWQVLASGNSGGESDEESERRLGELGKLVRVVVEAHAAVDHGNVGKAADPDAEVGRHLLNALDVTYGPFDGMYVSLDRRRINDFIKLLRRGRDSAFGRDE